MRWGEIVIASRHGDFPVKKGDKVAGMRVVPLVIEEEKMEAGQGALRRRASPFPSFPFRQIKVGIVTTGSEVYHGRIRDQFTPVVEAKLREWDAQILGNILCSDDVSMEQDAIGKWIREGADMVVCTGGMSVDPDDRTPLAIRSCADEVITYGAPVLPGGDVYARLPEAAWRRAGYPGARTAGLRHVRRADDLRPGASPAGGRRAAEPGGFHGHGGKAACA